MPHTYQQLLTELAEHLGLDVAGLLAQQEVRIGELSICLQQSGAQEVSDVVLCSVLGAPPAARFAEVLRTLMQANHRWVGTAGGTLGLSPAGDAITWCIRLPLRELDGTTLATWIAGFAELGQSWMQYIAADAGDAALVLHQGMRV